MHAVVGTGHTWRRVLKRRNSIVNTERYTFNREEEEKILPVYMLRLTQGYEYRTYWYEIFELFRKVAFVAVPAFFAEESIYAFMFILSMCFITFGGLMQMAPYDKETDDYVAQLAQVVASPSACTPPH